MKVYVCPICGKSLMPESGIYEYAQAQAGIVTPCGNHGRKLIRVLPLASPQEVIHE